MLHLLCDLQAIYVDRTFQVCPSMFTQLFTISGFVHGHQFPLFMPCYHPRTLECSLTIVSFISYQLVLTNLHSHILLDIIGLTLLSVASQLAAA